MQVVSVAYIILTIVVDNFLMIIHDNTAGLLRDTILHYNNYDGQKHALAPIFLLWRGSIVPIKYN